MAAGPRFDDGSPGVGGVGTHAPELEQPFLHHLALGRGKSEVFVDIQKQENAHSLSSMNFENIDINLLIENLKLIIEKMRHAVRKAFRYQ